MVKHACIYIYVHVLKHGGPPAGVGHPGGRRTGGHPGGRRTGGRHATGGHTHMLTLWREGGRGGSPNVEAGNVCQQLIGLYHAHRTTVGRVTVQMQAQQPASVLRGGEGGGGGQHRARFSTRGAMGALALILLDPCGPAARSDPPVFPLRSSWCLLRPSRALRSFWCLSRSPRVSSGALGVSWILQ
jgi:hypothetical protein